MAAKKFAEEEYLTTIALQGFNFRMESCHKQACPQELPVQEIVSHLNKSIRRDPVKHFQESVVLFKPGDGAPA